jgi:superfamily II DNA/RNA helicase
MAFVLLGLLGGSGRDLIGVAQTGTGKTAAFVLPTFSYLGGMPPIGQRWMRPLVRTSVTPYRRISVR